MAVLSMLFQASLYLVASAICILGLTYILTFIQHKLGLLLFNSGSTGKALTAPQIPYLIPWIGNTPALLDTTSHRFWDNLFRWYPRSLGVCQIVLGGNKTNMLFDNTANQFLLKDRSLHRDNATFIVVNQCMGVNANDAERYLGFNKNGDRVPVDHEGQDVIHTEYLLKASRANELTFEFTQALKQEIVQYFEKVPSTKIGLYKWLRTLMFRASAGALMGSRMIEICGPKLEDYFFEFDQDLLSLYFGLPNMVMRRALKNRSNLLKLLADYHTQIEQESGGVPADPNEVAWVPTYGSRVNRARQALYKQAGISLESKAALDLGMLFGLQSNAIPATGWMLFYILHSLQQQDSIDGEKPLYEWIMGEIQTAQRNDGQLDIAKLINLPIFQSLLHEVLRVHVDVLITRSVPNRMEVPLSSKFGKKSLHLPAKSLVMMHSVPAHTDPSIWQLEYPHHPPPDVFYPYRFLTSNPHDNSQVPKFTTSHATGSFFPFGGGRSICPGRVFAKQEMMAAVAIVLLSVDFEVLAFLDNKGRPSNSFPVVRPSFPGSAVCVPSGDIRVRIKSKN